MFNFNVDTRAIEKLARDFERKMDKQHAYATRLTVNKLAERAHYTLKFKMGEFFQAPTPYTRNSLYIQFARKNTFPISAFVYHKDESGKARGGMGTPASKYLMAEIEGGKRRPKASEKLFGYFWTPSKHVKLDQYGNVPGSFVVKVISEVKKFGEAGFSANRTARSTRRQRAKGTLMGYYIMPFGNARGIKPGVYKREGDGKQIPIFFFSKTSPDYTKRYPMAATVQQVVRENWGELFKRHMDLALATARK